MIRIRVRLPIAIMESEPSSRLGVHRPKTLSSTNQERDR
jgi:hypothetical protein